MDRRSSNVAKRSAAASGAVGAARARPRAKATDPDSTRQAILDAALDLFAERGFHGTAVPLVAERAGVGAGTVYRYFASKEALVNELFQFWKHELGRTLLTDFPHSAGMRQQFHEVWRRISQF